MTLSATKTAITKAKVRDNYTCQECGSIEFIQAHHQILGDDTSLISLCGDCHSRKHPEVPKALFFSSQNQPYWHTKPAYYVNTEDRMLLTLKEVAKILRVNTRTVRRLIKTGDVKGFKIGGAWRVRTADIDALLVKGAGSEHATRETK